MKHIVRPTQDTVLYSSVMLSLVMLVVFLLSACSTGEPPTARATPSKGSWTGRFYYGDNLAWASQRNLTNRAFVTNASTYKQRGFMMVDVDVRSEGRGARYSAVWQENVDNRAWREHHDLTSSEYHDLWKSYRADGYRPLDVEAYQLDGRVRYAGIWIENKEKLGWWSQRGMTSSEYAQHFKEQRAAGLRPIDIEIYPTRAGLRFAAIWYENVDGLAWSQLRNIDRNRYQQEVDAHAARGHQMVDFESYEGANGQLYAAIWERPADRPASAIRTNRSALGFANLWRQYRDEGYRLVDFENYDAADGVLYGGIWIENSERYRYDKKKEIDAAVEAYRTNNVIPGISVAIMHRGQLVYRRGFGMADQAAGKVAHAETVYKYASVSKVIGGTLAAKLEAEGRLRDGTSFGLDLSRPTSDYLTDLPDHHIHNVEELTAHLGCVAHYTTTPNIPNQTTHYDNDTEAAASFWDTVLANNCSVGATRSYSTPAFTLLGAVMEQATDRSIDELLEEELFKPYNLSSMRNMWSQSTLPANYERAVPYNDSGNAVTYGNDSWKVLGGGIEGNVVDLARFGELVRNGTIVNADVRDERLWTPVAEDCESPSRGKCQYGVSWDLQQSNSSLTIAEHLGLDRRRARSLLRVYQEEELVIAILTNRAMPNPTALPHNPRRLADSIANLVLP